MRGESPGELSTGEETGLYAERRASRRLPAVRLYAEETRDGAGRSGASPPVHSKGGGVPCFCQIGCDLNRTGGSLSDHFAPPHVGSGADACGSAALRLHAATDYILPGRRLRE